MFTRHGRNQNKHFCILRREALEPGESPADFAYRQAKQDYFIRDLERYNIRAVMVESYEQVDHGSAQSHRSALQGQDGLHVWCCT